MQALLLMLLQACKGPQARGKSCGQAMPMALCGKRVGNLTAWAGTRFGLETALETSHRARSPAQERNLTQRRSSLQPPRADLHWEGFHL